MTATVEVADDEQRVVAWRTEFALLLGYRTPRAILIAEQPEIDLHRLEQHIEHGCSLELAYLIEKP